VTIRTHAKEWLEQAIGRLVLGARENHLCDFDGQAAFDAPVVRVADGDDPLFERFREVVSPQHMLPREILRQYAPADSHMPEVRVVVWALPFTQAVRRSNRRRKWPSKLYSLARNNGGALNVEVRRRFTEMLHKDGWLAVAPALMEGYDAFRSSEHTFTSTWSERHAAYAAGLGKFGLSGCLITPVGVSVRLGSIVTNMPLDVMPRGCGDYRAPCLALNGAGCARCIERCPAGAISATGLDKSKCYAMRQAVRARHMNEYSRTLRMLPAPIVKSGKRTSGYSLGCALCQCGVPCEGRIPRASSRAGAAHA
jgi:epoxyqueuosine reductase QueG